MLNNTKYSLGILLLVLSINNQVINAQEWKVPENKKTVLCDFEFNEQIINTGKTIYTTNCRSCHGIPGEADFINLIPAPGDPASDKFQSNADGELYYKIREGREQMPSFKNVLSVTEVWSVISYIRSFHDSYRQQISDIIKITNLKWKDILIVLSADKETNTIKAYLSGTENNMRTPIEGADINLFAYRYFGKLQLDESKKTNKSGYANFNIPEDLPGDSAGFISINAILDEEVFGTIRTDTILNIGVPISPVSLVKDRAIWNVSSKAPLWLLLTYGLGALIVWIFIFYLMFQLKAIFKIGENIKT